MALSGRSSGDVLRWLAAGAIIAILRIYQLVVSPLMHRLPGAGCRFYPSCSEYAVQATRAFGAATGLRMTIGRIARCHPFHPGGHDPPMRRS